MRLMHYRNQRQICSVEKCLPLTTHRSLRAIKKRWGKRKISLAKKQNSPSESFFQFFMTQKKKHFHWQNIFFFCLPSIVTSNAPNANRMDRLCIQNSQIFRIDKLQSSFIQIQEQVFALKLNHRRWKSCFPSGMKKKNRTASKKKLTSPHRPTTSSKSFLPNDKSRMHLFTAFDERSGVRSSSAISTQPSDRTANLMGLSVSDFKG